jgi:hypothetical protein
MIPYRISATSGLQSATRVATAKVGMLSRVRRVWPSMLDWGDAGLDQTSAVRGPQPERVEGEGDGDEGRAVENCGRALVGQGAVQFLPHYLRWERYKGDHQQEHQVQHEEAVVRGADAPEHLMVIEPQDPDQREADDEGDVAGPLLGQSVGERTALLVHADLDDQERDGDGKHAIGEGLEPAGICLALHDHSILPEYEPYLMAPVFEALLEL